MEKGINTLNNIAEIKNLTLAYDGSTVLRDLSFDIKKGEILLISGENGSGKSTLIKALLGLIKPVSGNITLSDSVKGGIGYLPQQSQNEKSFPATVKEVVFSGFAGNLKYGIFLPRDAKARYDRAIELTGIAPLEKRCFSELSGGQQQRVLLSRALCASRSMLLLDEPTNALDPESASHMYSIITSLKHHEGLTVVMVSHDLETSVAVADRVLHLCCDGAFCCPAEEYTERVRAVHKENRGGTAHECTCGLPSHNHHDHKEESHDCQ